MKKQKPVFKKINPTLKSWNLLTPDPELERVQNLMPIDPADRERLKADIKQNGVRDSLKAYQKGGKLFIIGGFNRWQIARELDLKALLPVDIYGLVNIDADGDELPAGQNIDPEEIASLAIADNLNRRHLTTDQKRNLIEYFLKADPEQSNRQIGKKAGADKDTVKKVRTDLQRRGEIRHTETVTDTTGRKQPAKKESTKPKPTEPPAKAAADPLPSKITKNNYGQAADKARDLLDGLDTKERVHVIQCLLNDLLSDSFNNNISTQAVIIEIEKIIKPWKEN